MLYSNHSTCSLQGKLKKLEDSKNPKQYQQFSLLPQFPEVLGSMLQLYTYTVSSCQNY